MPRAISFSVTFATVEAAKKFVKEVTLRGAPCLRNGAVVHTMAVDGDEMRATMAVARRLGAEDL